LTGVTLDSSELKFLEKGLKFAVPPLKPDIALDNLVLADLTVGLEKQDNAVSVQCAKILKDYPIDEIPMNTRRTLNSIRRKVKDNDLCISKADKGNSIVQVIMTRIDYDRKEYEFIDQNDGKKVNFNFVKFSNSVKKCIKESEFLIDDRYEQYLVIMNPIPPRFYGLPKIHQAQVPIRPIVSYISSPTYRLCKFLDHWSKTLLIFDQSIVRRIPKNSSAALRIFPPLIIRFSFHSTSLAYT